MTDDTRKALVEIGLKMAQSAHDGGCDTHGHAIELFTEQVERDGDCIEALSSENERLRKALREVFEEWAGSEGFIPETAPEGYLLQLTKRMADIARAALGETK